MNIVVSSATTAAQLFHRIGSAFDAVGNGLSQTRQSVDQGVRQTTQAATSSARNVASSLGSVIDVFV